VRVMKTACYASTRTSAPQPPLALALLATPFAVAHAGLDALVARDRRAVARPTGVARVPLRGQDVVLLPDRVKRFLSLALGNGGRLGREGEEKLVVYRERVVREREGLSERVVKRWRKRIGRDVGLIRRGRRRNSSQPSCSPIKQREDFRREAVRGRHARWLLMEGGRVG
jgi:hypothetical protein